MHNPTIREVQYFKDGFQEGKLQAEKEIEQLKLRNAELQVKLYKAEKETAEKVQKAIAECEGSQAETAWFDFKEKLIEIFGGKTA